MKNRKLKLILSILLILAASCNLPETVVTNIIHPDGSVTRRIEMKNVENNFAISDIQVPFDSTWTVRDSIEINDEGDTIWVVHAEKLFDGVDGINRDYRTDSGVNKAISRHAEFRKQFKWFNTKYIFSENIDKIMLYGYPVADFLDQEELQWFYLPGNLQEEKKNGADSLKFRTLNDTVDKKVEKWYIKILVSEWIGEFDKLTGERKRDEIPLESLKQRQDEFARIVERDLENFDSLWTNGSILREFLGEANELKYKVEADSAAILATDRFMITFKDYTVRTFMPGKLTGTNGFVDSTGIVLWPVKSDYFLAEPYVMLAESKISNKWAWIVSGLFLVFVVTGIILRRKKKG